MNTERPRRRFQFGLRQLIGTMVVLSVVCALSFTAPGWVTSTTAIVIPLVAVSLLVTVSIYGRGETRAFYIGSIFPAIVTAIPAMCLWVVAILRSFRNNYEDMFRQLDQAAYGMRMAVLVGIVVTCLAASSRSSYAGGSLVTSEPACVKSQPRRCGLSKWRPRFRS